MLSRLQEKRRFIQILFGPRQVGKTTLVHQALARLKIPVVFASTDAEVHATGFFLSQQWDLARLRALGTPAREAVLVVDEVQKIPRWSEYVKKEWDEDTRNKRHIKVILLGSSSLLIQKGMSESLAGRFELIRIPHWSYPEMKAAFGTSLDEYLFFGGYPGAASLSSDEPRWKQYVRDAIIEPAISRDVLMMTRIDKPALLRQLFHMGAVNSGRIISYTKLLGQLQDAGNTTTLAHYLSLLTVAGLLSGLQKFSGSRVKIRSSSPKFQTFNSALLSALSAKGFRETRADPEEWGHFVESAVGSHLLNAAFEQGLSLSYWREGNHEVDFILGNGDCHIALEVKSGKRRESLPGMDRFCRQYQPHRSFVVGSQGIPLEEFLALPPLQLFG